MKKITDKVKIREILHGYMLSNSGFVVELFTREHRKGGMIYEGVRPLSSATCPNETIYTLTNGDSGYTRGIESVSLSKIEYIGIL